MRRRVLAAIMVVAVLTILLFGIPLTLAIERLVDEQASLRLERRAVLAAREVPVDFATTGDAVELPDSDGVTFGLYDPSGTLVTGTGPAQADRSVRLALSNGVAMDEAGPLHVTAIPVTADEAVIGALRAAQPAALADDRTTRALVLVAGLGVLALAVGAGAGQLAANRLTRPVRRLRDAAVRLGGGDFSISVPASGIDEVDEASDALATTARRLDDLIGRERAFSADASHQLRTPLAALRTAIETELAFPGPDRDATLRDALEDIDRLEATIAELLALARTPATAQATLSPATLLDQLRSRWNGPLAAQGRPLVVLWPMDLAQAMGTAALVSQALDVLVDNALRHGQGEVRVEARSTPDSVTISVIDHGPGLGAPGASTSSSDRHGLGLPLARRLVEACSGRLVIAHTGHRPEIEVVLARAPAGPPTGRSPGRVTTGPA